MHTGFWIEASVEIVKTESSSHHQKYETDCSVQRQKQEQDHICKEQRRLISELLKTKSVVYAREGGGGGGYLTKFNTERLRPVVQPLTL